ncbi:hypothetical protein M9Y10_012062 [Tritrichomonas musculus]|uniref:Actin n=1 Tax=Tritrichomonas musculus TaxID=1915356 RepID=A0ABR2ICK1_9EUKA
MEVSTVVIDNGSSMIKAGMSGYERPSILIPSIVARPKNPNVQTDILAPKEVYIGSDALKNDGQVSLNISHPIKDRKITSTEDLEKIWGYIFNDKLKVKPEEHPVIITEPPLTPESTRMESMQIMFETFNAAAYYTSCPEVFTLFSAGLTSGIAIDSGETLTDVLPVFECYPMYHVFSRLPIGGYQIDTYLKRLLLQSGIEIPDKKEMEILRDIKEKLCYVTSDLEEEQQKYEHVNEIEKTYQMPDGPEVHIGAQRFRSVEPLFDPRLIQIQSESLPQMIYETINKCGDLKQEMYKKIVLSGGTSLFPGLKERLQKDLTKLVSSNNTKINVIGNENRNNAAWFGGSILASQSSFSMMWITKDEYHDVGQQILNLKCF